MKVQLFTCAVLFILPFLSVKAENNSTSAEIAAQEDAYADSEESPPTKPHQYVAYSPDQGTIRSTFPVLSKITAKYKQRKNQEATFFQPDKTAESANDANAYSPGAYTGTLPVSSDRVNNYLGTMTKSHRKSSIRNQFGGYGSNYGSYVNGGGSGSSNVGVQPGIANNNNNYNGNTAWSKTDTATNPTYAGLVGQYGAPSGYDNSYLGVSANNGYGAPSNPMPTYGSYGMGAASSAGFGQVDYTAQKTAVASPPASSATWSNYGPDPTYSSYVNSGKEASYAKPENTYNTGFGATFQSAGANAQTMNGGIYSQPAVTSPGSSVLNGYSYGGSVRQPTGISELYGTDNGNGLMGNRMLTTYKSGYGPGVSTAESLGAGVYSRGGEYGAHVNANAKTSNYGFGTFPTNSGSESDSAYAYGSSPQINANGFGQAGNGFTNMNVGGGGYGMAQNQEFEKSAVNQMSANQQSIGSTTFTFPNTFYGTGTQTGYSASSTVNSMSQPQPQQQYGQQQQSIGGGYPQSTITDYSAVSSLPGQYKSLSSVTDTYTPLTAFGGHRFSSYNNNNNNNNDRRAINEANSYKVITVAPIDDPSVSRFIDDASSDSYSGFDSASFTGTEPIGDAYLDNYGHSEKTNIFSVLPTDSTVPSEDKQS